MAMSRERYREVAGIIGSAAIDGREKEKLAREMAAFFKRDRSEFRPDVFLRACEDAAKASGTAWGAPLAG